MSSGILKRNRRTCMTAVGTILFALMSSGLAVADDQSDNDNAVRVKTKTPIKHLIVLIGENRTFDHVFATYQPKHDQSVANLLSNGIILANGAPGPNFLRSRQFQINQPFPAKYFIDAFATAGKTAYQQSPGTPVFPAPNTDGAPQAPDGLAQGQAPFSQAAVPDALLPLIEPSLEKEDLGLLRTGATGLPGGSTDTRIANAINLPNGVFQITGPTLPYDSFTGDMVHRLFHMWQQSDCDVRNATPSNPSGCLNDLYPFVGVARNDDSGGNSMGFYNVLNGDAPIFKRLADEYTINDNYHQPVMGGTAVQHIMIGTADALPWEQVGAFPAQPPAKVVANPNPKSATNAGFITDGRWTECGDHTQPGIQPIMDYLKSLPWRPDLTKSNGAPNTFYMINNARPGFLSNGQLNTAGINAGTAVPPSSLRTIGDALNEKNISWAFYGGGFNAAARFDNGSTDPVDVMIGTGGDFYCDICNPFQYAKSIMGDPAQRQAHIKDAVDFFA